MYWLLSIADTCFDTGSQKGWIMTEEQEKSIKEVQDELGKAQKTLGKVLGDNQKTDYRISSLVGLPFLILLLLLFVGR